MIKYYTSSIYRKHYSNLEKLHLIDDALEIELFDISNYILKRFQQSENKPKSPLKANNSTISQIDQQKYFIDLIQDLEVYKNITLNPIKIFKSLMLIHCSFLLIKVSPKVQSIDKLNEYFKWIQNQTEKLIEKFQNKEFKKKDSFFGKSINSATKENKQIFSGFKSTNQIVTIRQKNNPRSKSTARKNSSSSIMTKQLCILLNIIKPYIMYLQKILSIYSHYQNLLHAIPNTMQSSEQATWTILNIFKLQSPIIKIFRFIGRYFYKQYSSIVYFLIELFGKQINRMYPKIYAEAQNKIQQIAHEWFVLLEKHSQYEIFSDDNIQIPGIQRALLLLDQIVQVNEVLFHVYFGKYFYQVVQKLNLPEPKWFDISSKDCEFLMQYNNIKIKKNRKKLRQSSKDKKQSMKLTDQKKSQLSKSVILRQNTSVHQYSNTYQQIMVIQKKNVLPKVKNSLKIGKQKDNKDKQDIITFRSKEFPSKLNQSTTEGENSITNQN